MKIFGLHILTKNQLAALKSFGLSELDKAIAAAKQTQLGAIVAATVKELESGTLSGPEKLVHALAIVTPLVVSYAEQGGLKAAVADAETFARHLIESVLDDVKATKVGLIARAILKLLGIG